MSKPESRFLNYIFIGVFIALILPYIQSTLNIVKLDPLGGAYQKTEDADFTVAGWFSGEYQEQYEKFFNENFGFRNFFVRLDNQIAYNLFNKAKANEVIIGKEGYLYEMNYLLAYAGKDFIGEDSIRANMQRLKFVQDYLQKENKTVLLVFAPGKGSFYPEYIPDEYLIDKGPRNYDYCLKACQDIGINLIDFNGYFVLQKEKSKYLLYPKYGIHWSHYGMCTALDSIVHWLEKTRKVNLVNPTWNEVKIEEPSNIDSDIAMGMNLLWKPAADKMAYPELIFKDEKEAVKPSAIVIGDSFYWDMFNITPRIFNENNHFWYYNKEVFPQKDNKHKMVDDINLRQELNEHDIFILMCTEANYSRIGWRFIENTYNLLKNGIEPGIPDFKAKIDKTIKYIRSDEKWMEVIRHKAKKEKCQR